MVVLNPRRAAIAVASLLTLGLTAAVGLATVPEGQQDTISDGVGRRSSVAISGTDGRAMVAFDRGNVANNTQTFGRAIDRAGNPVGPVFPITDAKSQGRGSTNSPAIAHNGFRDEYFVVWAEDILAGAERKTEIFGRRLAPDGTRVGAPVQLSATGPDDDRTFAGVRPEIAYSTTRDEYLVVWIGSADRQGFGANEQEVFGRRVSGAGIPIGIDGFRVSTMGPTKSEEYGPRSLALTFNPDDGEYLVVWEGDTQMASIPPLVDNEFEIFGQRLTVGGVEIGDDDFRISDAGPPADINFRAERPDVSYSPVSNQYLVVWRAREPFNGATDRQIYAQRLSRSGAEIGESDFLVSEAARDGIGEPVASQPEVTASSRSDEFFIVWTDGSNSAQLFGERRDGNGALVGPSDVSLATKAPDDTSSPSDVAYSVLDNRYMATWTYADMDQINSDVIDRRLVMGAEAVLPVPLLLPPGTPPGGGIPGTSGAPSAANCLPVDAVTGTGASGTLSLTTTQLRINQRIGQAAVRRANAVQRWLDAGIVNGDICGGSLIGDQLHSGVMFSQDLLQAVPGRADPRPLVIPVAQAKPAATFSLTARQLKINQNVYSAALRRANALKARIGGRLTGGDIKDGELTADRLRQDLILGTLTAAATVPGASTTQVADPDTKKAVFSPTLRQLRINQRIAQAAVKRTNDLRATVGAGLTGRNFVAGSITAADWAAP